MEEEEVQQWGGLRFHVQTLGARRNSPLRVSSETLGAGRSSPPSPSWELGAPLLSSLGGGRRRGRRKRDLA